MFAIFPVSIVNPIAKENCNILHAQKIFSQQELSHLWWTSNFSCFAVLKTTKQNKQG